MNNKNKLHIAAFALGILMIVVGLLIGQEPPSSPRPQAIILKEMSPPQEVQALLDAKEPVIYIRNPGGTMTVTQPIVIRHPVMIVFEEGCTVIGRGFGQTDNLFDIQAENVAILARGSSFAIERNEGNSGSPVGGGSHVFNIRGSKYVTIANANILGGPGDGIYIGVLVVGEERRPCMNVAIANVTIDNVSRNGISVTAIADNGDAAKPSLVIRNCTISNVKGHPPQCGMDFEPSHKADPMQDAVVMDCDVRIPGSHGYLTNLTRLKTDSPPVSIVFKNVSVNGLPFDGQAFRVQGIGHNGGPKGIVERCNGGVCDRWQGPE